MKGRHLPNKNINEKEYKELIKKEYFYVCLVTLGVTKDRFKRLIKPTKIIKINDYKLVPEKGREFNYNTSIYYFYNYKECAEHFNQQIDKQSKYIKEQIERIKNKYEQMIKMKINIRQKKFNRILK